jgi:hypothetical protein
MEQARTFRMQDAGILALHLTSAQQGHVVCGQPLQEGQRVWTVETDESSVQRSHA